VVRIGTNLKDVYSLLSDILSPVSDLLPIYPQIADMDVLDEHIL
jgi:hypothetical protein